MFPEGKVSGIAANDQVIQHFDFQDFGCFEKLSSDVPVFRGWLDPAGRMVVDQNDRRGT